MKQRWSTKALADLDAIRDQSLMRWGSTRTKAYIRLIRAAVNKAGRAPLQTSPADHYRPGYRKIVAGTHVIFFRPGDGTIDIIRILHAAMDIDAHLD